MLGNMSPGAAITPLLPCLQRSDALKFTNIEEKYKCKNTMQMEDIEKKHTPQDNRIVVCWGNGRLSEVAGICSL